MKQYLVITVVDIAARSAKDAAERAAEFQAQNGVEAFVQRLTSVTEAASEAALVGAKKVTL